MPLPGDILQDMLHAAEQAGAAQWNKFSGDAADFIKRIAENGAKIAADYEDGDITEDQAKVLLDGISDATDMVANYAEQSVKLAAQNAINAAVGVLWSAILAIR